MGMLETETSTAKIPLVEMEEEHWYY